MSRPVTFCSYSYTFMFRQKAAALNNLLGAVVVTKYNNKTYKIDDIAWNLNPLCKFPFKGNEISYMEYYQTVIFFHLLIFC